MKVSLSLLLSLSSVSAFTPQQQVHRQTTELFAETPLSSRQAFLRQAAATSAACMVGVLQPSTANAAKYGSFGAGSSAVLDPKTADVDAEILASSAVQSALNKVKGYQTVVRTMASGLDSDPQLNLRSYIVKELDFAGLRATLNTVNTAFDEETQLGTDRLIRVILQDITELETANTLKDGVSRSERRLDIMKGKLAKLDKAFSDYLAFAN